MTYCPFLAEGGFLFFSLLPLDLDFLPFPRGRRSADFFRRSGQPFTERFKYVRTFLTS